MNGTQYGEAPALHAQVAQYPASPCALGVMCGILPFSPHILQRRAVRLPGKRRWALVVTSAKTAVAATSAKAAGVLVAGCWHARVLVAANRRARKAAAAGATTKATSLHRWRTKLWCTTPLLLLLLLLWPAPLAAGLRVLLLLTGHVPLLLLLLLLLLASTVSRGPTALLLLAGPWCRL